MRFILLGCFIVLFTYCQKQELSLTINLDYLKKSLEEELTALESPDLKSSISDKDYLPSGWDYDGDEHFFEIERKAFSEGWIVIYLMKVDEEVVDIRVATYINDELVYNYPIWSYSNIQSDFSILKKLRGRHLIEMYRNDLLVSTYYPEQGEFVPNNK